MAHSGTSTNTASPYVSNGSDGGSSSAQTQDIYSHHSHSALSSSLDNNDHRQDQDHNNYNKHTKKGTFEPLELEPAEERSEIESNCSSDDDDEYSKKEQQALLSNTDSHNISENHNSNNIRVYRQRWVQLAYLSALALLSDWICFSVAASKENFEELFDIQDSTELIDWFLFTNVITCFMVTDCVAFLGLQRCIQAAAVLMAIGTWLRYLAASVLDYNYTIFTIGTLFVGAAQPFFQCTPPLLSAVWFASHERATATAIALNFNQVGIATAFLVGGPMGDSARGLQQYFGIMAAMGTLLSIGTVCQFQAQPPSPPSMSEYQKLQHAHQEPPFFTSARQFFSTPGFLRALAAFICSITITNVVGALIEPILHRGGVTETWHVSLAGAAFEVAIVLGGIVLGGYVDRTKRYKFVTLLCLGLSMIFVVPLGWTEHEWGKEPKLMVGALILLGFFTGPIQPINAELAVDVTYPGDETAVESVQQIGGNLVSALFMPLAEWAAEQDYDFLTKFPGLASDIRGDVVLLLVVSLATLLYFGRFNAPLRRTMADKQQQERAGRRGDEGDESWDGDFRDDMPC